MSTAMEKNAHTNVTVAQAAPGGDPQGARPGAPLPAPGEPRPGGGLPNPIVIIRRTLAHWPVAAIVMVLGVLATAQVIRARKPLFKSETVIFYRPGVLGDGESKNEILRTLGIKLKEMLLAQSNLKKVIEEKHLYSDVVEKRGYSDAVDVFRKNIDFKARSNDTFAISFQGSSRDEAQAITERLADMIVEENARARKERTKDATEFHEAEKKRVDDELEKLETELAQFMADHPEFVTESGGRGGAAVRAEQKKVGAAAAAERQAAQRRTIASGGAPIVGKGNQSVGPSAPPVDPVLLATRSQAMSELLAAKKELADKSVKFTNQHPDVRAAEARIASAEASLQKAEEAIRAAAPPPPPPVVNTPEDPYADTKKPANPRVGSPASPGSQEAKPKAPERASEATLVTLETEWSRLNREVTKVRQQQQQIETKVFQAQIAASSEVGGYAASISILDPAFKPAGPSGLPNRIIILGGFAASLVFGIVLAGVRGLFLDDRLFDASEVDGLGLTPVLGIVPKRKLEKKTKTRGARA